MDTNIYRYMHPCPLFLQPTENGQLKTTSILTCRYLDLPGWPGWLVAAHYVAQAGLKLRAILLPQLSVRVSCHTQGDKACETQVVWIPVWFDIFSQYKLPLGAGQKYLSIPV